MDHRFVARAERGSCLAGGVIGGEPGVRQRGHVGGLQRLIELDHRACVGPHEFRVAAVAVDGRHRQGLFAVHVVALAARAAQPAGWERVQDDRVPHRHIGHC